MAGTHYRHTQIGWPILALSGAAAALMVVLFADLPVGGSGWIGPGVLALAMVLFGSLTVAVDEREIHLHFGPGVVRKRIALADVRGFAAVRNPWTVGWGIRLGPGYTLYNVAGLDAVEIVLGSGKRIRIGTDEPAALCAAIELIAGRPAALPPGERGASPRSHRRILPVLAVLGLVLAVVLGAIFWFHELEPRVEVAADGFSVRSALYGEHFAFRDVSSITLEERLPGIRLRTNGYAWPPTLRGHFRLDGLGDGQLYVEADTPPFVLLRSGDRYVFVNYSDPAATRRLHAELLERWVGVSGE